MPEADDQTVPDGTTTDAAQGADQATSTTDAPPPWGDDFNPERAWQTITHLRGRERELESEAKQLKRLREDEEAQREFLTELGYQIEDPDPDDDPDDDPDGFEDPIAEVRDQVSDLAQWRQQQEDERAITAFKTDLENFAEEAKVELNDRDRARILRESLEHEKGFGPEAVKATLDALIEERQELERQAIERYTQSKKTPHVPASGKSATELPNLDNDQDRRDWMVERLQSARGQS